MLECPSNSLTVTMSTPLPTRREAKVWRSVLPRHIRDSRLFTSERESSFQIDKRFAGLGIVEDEFVLLAQVPGLKNLAGFGVNRNLADSLGLGRKDTENSFVQIHVRPAQRENLSDPQPRIQREAN